MNYKITLFKDNEELSFNVFGEVERKSIEETIYNFAIDKKDCDGIELNIDLLDDENEQVTYGIICNVNEKKISKFLNKKTVFNPPQYGLISWGKVELFFSLMNENEEKLCEYIIDKLKKDKVILDAQLEEQTERLKNMKLKKSSKKKSNNYDNVSVASAASSASSASTKSTKSAATSISKITTISDISLAKECSTTIRKCSKCKLPGHNISKCPMISEEKEIKVSNEKKISEHKETKVVKKCSNCKLPGHNINKCPSRKDVSSNSVPDTDSENESKISKISGSTKSTSEKETSIRKCSKCSTPGHTIRKCPLNIM